MQLFYLPAYLPDFNPIEKGFLLIKAWICCSHDFVIGELTGDPTCNLYFFSMLWEAVFSTMTPEAIKRWFHDSGYV